MNIINEIQPRQVGCFERTEKGEAEAEPVFHDPVDIFRLCNPFFHEGNGLAPQGVLQPVSEKPWNILEDADRLLPDPLHQLDDGLK